MTGSPDIMALARRRVREMLAETGPASDQLRARVADILRPVVSDRREDRPKLRAA